MLPGVAGGYVEERLRAWVERRTVEYGERAKLSKHLKKARNWATKYVTGETDADLDTAIAIAKFYRLPITTLAGETALPDPSPDTHRILTLWATIDRGYQPEIFGVLEAFVGLPPRAVAQTPSALLANVRKKTGRKSRGRKRTG